MIVSSQSPHSGLNLYPIVEELCSPDGEMHVLRKFHEKARQLPRRDLIVDTVEKIREVLFPGYFGNSEVNKNNVKYYIGAAVDQISHEIREQIRRGFCFECGKFGIKCPECAERAERMSDELMRSLPDIQRRLSLDVQAAYEGDPAATSPDETIFCYPGVQAMTYHRIAHRLHEMEVPIIPRIISEHAHSVTGIDIHPAAKIGERFFIDHGTGVVIGATCIIGKRVRIYQGVTLGAKSFPLDKHGKPVKGVERHPIVEDDVIIYSGATILGRVVIGKGSIIGGNVWLTQDVPPGSRITQRTAKHERFENGGGI